MTADRLTEIAAFLSGDAFRALGEAGRAALVQEYGSIPAAKAHAFEALPEARRLGLINAVSAPPAACGPELPIAPARGALRVFEMLEAYPDGAQGTVLRPGGFAGRKTAQVADAFDRMRAQAERRGAAPAFTDSQIGMGRMYATLIRDRDAGGMRGCWPSGGGGGGTREGFTDHRLAQSRRIDLYQHRIGAGVALAVRRVRPSDRADGAKRGAITDRALVDAVCLDDLTLSEVLERMAWSVKSDHIAAVGRALAAALDRMIGPWQRAGVQALHVGPKAEWTHKKGD